MGVIYVRGSTDHVLTYGGGADDSKHIIKDYPYSNFVKCLDSRKFVSGYLFTCYNGVVS